MKSEASMKTADPTEVFNTLTEDLFIDYKWEELIVKMCSSENPELREMGIREYKSTKLKSPNFLSGHISRLKLN
jgi:hypothetical protein